VTDELISPSETTISDDSRHSNQSTASSSPSLLQLTTIQQPKELSQAPHLSSTQFPNSTLNSGETSPRVTNYWGDVLKMDSQTTSEQINPNQLADVMLRMNLKAGSAVGPGPGPAPTSWNEDDAIRFSRKSSTNSMNTMVALTEPSGPILDHRREWETGSNSSLETEGQLLEVCRLILVFFCVDFVCIFRMGSPRFGLEIYLSLLLNPICMLFLDLFLYVLILISM
jgi:hypothetical protein